MRNQQFNLSVGLDLGGGNTGAELNTAANATSLTNEANATTGWTQTGLDAGANVFESQGTTKQAGSYALHCDANDTPTANAAASIDLNGSPYSLTVGKQYIVTCYGIHSGVGGKWGVFLSSAATLDANLTTVGSILQTDTAAWVKVTYTFTHSANTRYLGPKEFNATNNGEIYFDSLSIKRINQ